MRTPLIAGNWKMNKTEGEALSLVRKLMQGVRSFSEVEVLICPPFTSIGTVGDIISGTPVSLGAQNMHWEEKGAFTGEISSNMLLTLGCNFVILGHSERREYFGETDEIVARKLKTALTAGLTPIVCVGETKSEREDGVTEKIIETQVKRVIEGLSPGEFDGTVMAYEPVWAIGTGLTATTEQAQEVHAFIRKLLGESLGLEIAEKTRIQYGGSMKPDNAGELLAEPDIDGGLIGGAALDAESFKGIIEASIL